MALGFQVARRSISALSRCTLAKSSSLFPLAALEAVDVVVVFDEDTPVELIKRVRPAVLVKGADYRLEDVVGREVVEAAGGDVILVGLVPGQSTSGLVQRSAKSAAAPAARARSTKPAKS